MDERLDRYRLALALIPDPTAAGDLFMASRSEADLRRRAARWRQRQGLPPADENPALPELDETQREHALHLARRGAAHRRMTRWLTAAALVAGLTAGGYLLREALLPGLDSHPAFAGQPVALGHGMNNLTLALYKAEAKVAPVGASAYDLEFSLWWEVTGPGAADAYRFFRPQLYVPLPRTQRTEWLETSTTRRFSTRPDRVLGVSHFQVRLPVASFGRNAIFRLREGPETESDFSAPLRLPPPSPAGGS